MGYTGDLMSPTLTAVAAFQKDLTTIVHLFGDDSSSLVRAAHTIHGTDFEGDTAQALVTFAMNYQQLVQSNVAPLDAAAKACGTYHDGIQSACRTFDTAMPPGSNEIVDTIFAHHMFSALDILLSNSDYSFYYYVDPITPAVDRAYQMVVSRAEKQVPQNMAYEIPNEYGPIRDSALNHLQTWSQAIIQAYTDWAVAISIADGNIPPLAAIKGITIDPGQMQSIENDFDTMGAPNGVAYFHLSQQQQNDAGQLYSLYINDDPGLSLGFIEGMMSAGVSTDQISYMLSVWNTIDWGQVALGTYYSVELAAVIAGLAQHQQPDPASTPEDPIIRIEQPQPEVPYGDTPGNEILFKSSLRDGGNIVYYRNGTFRMYGPGQKLPSGADDAPPPPLGQKWIDYTTAAGTSDYGTELPPDDSPDDPNPLDIPPIDFG